MTDNTKQFVAYEYRDITVKPEQAVLYEDCYANFGWQLVERAEYGNRAAVARQSYPHAPYGVPTAQNIHHASINVPDKIEGPEMVTLKFKRDSKLCNKFELNKLQRTCDEALARISNIEKTSTAQTMGVALGLGIVGAAVGAISVYGFISGNIPLGVVLAVVATIAAGCGFVANNKISQKKSTEYAPAIDEQFQVVYNSCEQGHMLLAS